MENYVICPHCKRTITNNPLIETAMKGEGNGTQGITCECGETINYWEVTELLRGQKTLLSKIQSWWRSLSNNQA